MTAPPDERPAPDEASPGPTLTGAPGYLNEGYAHSLAEFGERRPLGESGGWLLCRAVPGATDADAMHTYPLLVCRDWSRLDASLGDLHDLVSVTAVVDPFAEVTPEQLARAFPDVLRPFKEHLVVDLPRAAPSAHHRARSRKAEKLVEVRIAEPPAPWLGDWTRLYAQLCVRKGITGLRAFSRPAFEAQLALPGTVGIAAFIEGHCVAMTLWYVMGDVVYYHLAASDEAGYRTSASHALFQAAISTFRERGVRWMSLGAGAGLHAKEDGLTRFKKGWATGGRMTYLGGRVMNRLRYDALSGDRPAEGYFPAYRAGELG